MSWTRRKFIRSGIVASLALLILDAFWFEQFFIEANEYFLKGVTAENAKLKVIQISDLHLNTVNAQLKKLAQKVNGFKPDLIFFTGDALDKANNLPLLDEFLSLIHIEIKKVAILGNWEYWGGIDIAKLKALYRAHNCDLLINESQQYLFRDKSILVTGTDDYLGGTPDIDMALYVNYVKSDYHIILNHCPGYTEVITETLKNYRSPDLILSGHTHGGQVSVFGLTPFLPPGCGKYVKGWYKTGVTDLYVSKGIGTSLLPVRFGSRAEIAVFNL